MKAFSRGVQTTILDIHIEGGAPDSTNMNKGREGVKNPENFADVLYGWPLTTYAFWLTPLRADVLNGRLLIML